MRLRVVEQGASTYVMGTDQIIVAAKALPAGVTGWSISETGLYARRKNGLRWHAAERAPKDARPGVRFAGLRRDPESDVAEEADR